MSSYPFISPQGQISLYPPKLSVLHVPDLPECKSPHPHLLPARTSGDSASCSPNAKACFKHALAANRSGHQDYPAGFSNRNEDFYSIIYLVATVNCALKNPLFFQHYGIIRNFQFRKFLPVYSNFSAANLLSF